MKFNVGKEFIKMLDILDKSAPLRRLAWGIVAALSFWTLAPLVTAIRWW